MHGERTAHVCGEVQDDEQDLGVQHGDANLVTNRHSCDCNKPRASCALDVPNRESAYVVCMYK